MNWPRLSWPPDWHDAEQRKVIALAVGALLLVIVIAIFLSPSGRRPGRAAVGVARVEGTVLLDGHPVADAAVTFLPSKKPGIRGQPPASFGRTDASGRFRLVLNGGRPGAVVGTHRVTVGRAPSLSATGSMSSTTAPLKSGNRIAAIPSRYADVSSSGLTAEVKPGDANDIPLRLTTP